MKYMMVKYRTEGSDKVERRVLVAGEKFVEAAVAKAESGTLDQNDPEYQDIAEVLKFLSRSETGCDISPIITGIELLEVDEGSSEDPYTDSQRGHTGEGRLSRIF